ncbi:MAG: dipeptidase [Pseudomonadota bacterium]
MSDAPLPIFDGHNDTLLRLARAEPAAPDGFFERGEKGHLDLPRAREGGFAGGMFAMFVPSKKDERQQQPEPSRQGYDVPLPAPPPLADAQRATFNLAANLFRIEEASQGQLKVVRTTSELRQCLDTGTIAAVLHIEGAEAIDPELDMLEVLYRAGLRSIGIVWSRANAFGQGVPFRYPSSPDIGPGLSEAGERLVKACNRLGILVDVSHLNEKGFWDVVRVSDAPIVATHSNAHALCQVSRNLTDDQLKAIRDSGGMVGVNFAVSFLRSDGSNQADTPLATVVEHVDYLIERLGVDGVGFGSDFDGATVPAEIGDAAGLPKLVDALRERYDDATLKKLGTGNWLRVLDATWRE